MSRARPTLAVLYFLVAATTVRAVDVGGWDAWRFGMSQEEVAAVSGLGPYTPVATTGGLETANGRFRGKQVTVSFVFGAAGLRQIQVWAYEGGDLQEAIAAFHGAFLYLSETFGPLRSGSAPVQPNLTLAELDQKVPPEFRTGAGRSELGQIADKGSIQAQIHKLHLHPQTPPAGAEVYASLIHSPEIGSYWVFVYFKSLPPGS
jgi:hypothetical protein